MAAYDDDFDYADIFVDLRSPNDASLGTFSFPRSRRSHIPKRDLLVDSIDRFDAPRTVIASEPDLRALIFTGFAAASHNFCWSRFFK